MNSKYSRENLDKYRERRDKACKSKQATLDSVKPVSKADYSLASIAKYKKYRFGRENNQVELKFMNNHYNEPKVYVPIDFNKSKFDVNRTKNNLKTKKEIKTAGVDTALLNLKKKRFKLIFFDFYFMFNKFFRLSNTKASALRKFYERFRFLRLKMLKAFFSLRRSFSFQKLLNKKRNQDTKGIFLKNIIRIQNNILDLFHQLHLNPRKFSSIIGKLLREYSFLSSVWCDLDKYGTFDRDLPVRQRRLLVKYYTKPGYFKKMYRDQKLIHKVIPFKYLIKQPKRGFYLKSLKITDHLFFWHAFTRKKLQQSFWLVRGKKFLKHFFSLKFAGFFSKLKKSKVLSLSLKNSYVYSMDIFLCSIQDFFLNTNFIIPEKKWKINSLICNDLLKIPFRFLLDSMLLKWKFFVCKLGSLYSFEINRAFGFMLGDCFGIFKILFDLFSKNVSLLYCFLLARVGVQTSLQYFFVFLFNNVFFSKFIRSIVERSLCGFSFLQPFECFSNDIYFFGNKKEEC